MTASALSIAVSTARDANVDVIVIGAAAMAVGGLVRSTTDLDLLAMEERMLWPRTWDAARRRHVGIDVRCGDEMDPLRGVVRIGPHARLPVDVVVGRGQWMRDIIRRTIGPDGPRGVFSGIELPVAKLSDIILLKLYAAAQDYVEDEDLFVRHPEAGRLIAEVSARIASLPRDCRERWGRIEPRWSARAAHHHGA